MYQVWTKDEFEGWKMVSCEDLPAAQAELMKALLSGKDPLLTVAVPYDFNVKIKEVPTEEKISAQEKYKKGIEGSRKEETSEVPKGKAKPGKGPGAEGKGEVRPGDTDSVPELG